MNDIDIPTLEKLLDEKDMKDKELCLILSLTPQNVSNLMNGRRKISNSEQKLLKLYFYNKMPFDMMRPPEELQDSLKFSGDEWRVMTVLATREGYINTQSWITSQIRGYLRNIESINDLDETLDSSNRNGGEEKLNA